MPDVTWTAFGKRLVFSWMSSTQSSDWRDDAVPSTADAYHKWDKQQRRNFGLLRTIKWFGPTNQPGKRWAIASLHWPHRLCWSWIVDWSVVHPECRGIKICCAYRQFALVLWCRQLSVHWQDSGYMVYGPHAEGAPKIMWRHEARSMMDQPLGRA